MLTGIVYIDYIYETDNCTVYWGQLPDRRRDQNPKFL